MFRQLLFAARFVKLRMAVYLAAFLFLAVWSTGQWELLLRGIAIVVLYAAFDVVWTFVRDRAWYVPLSSVISGFIISLVLSPQAPLWVVVLAVCVAVASKQTLKLWVPRHIFNPAAFALVVSGAFFFLVSQETLGYWWGVSWSAWWLVALLVLSGIFIITSIRRWPHILSFLVVHAVLTSWTLLRAGIDAGELPFVLKPLLWDGTTVFFMTVMLVEPMTSNFPGRSRGIFFGALAAFGAWVFGDMLAGGGIIHFLQDPLLAGLLFANISASLLFLRKK